jgi:curved DNA-binding protein CbpA
MKNSDKEIYLEYFEILELEENASLAEINQAYKKLKELYSSESIVTDPIDDEFSMEERQEIANQIETAYKGLLRYMVEKDRVSREGEDTRQKLEDTVKEEAAEEEESEEVLDLDEEEMIINDAFQDETIDEEDFKTIITPEGFTKNDGDTTINIHENEHEHEHVHIELPEQEIIPEEKEEALDKTRQETTSSFSTDVYNKDKKKVEKDKFSWVESLFEKDINEIKEELTRDIKQELTFIQKKAGDEEPPQEEFEGLKIKGRSLRKIREKLGFGIHEIALKTKINYKILVNIEKERFSKLPDAGHLRWYLTTYAKALFLDPQEVADQYMKRYRHWKKAKGE